MRPAVSPNFVAPAASSVTDAGRRAVHAAEIDGELAVDEHPDVVVADELQRLAAAVLEPVAHLAGEAEVVRHVIVVAAPEIVDLRPARRLGPSAVVDGEERRREPADRRRVAPHLRVVVDEGAVRLPGQRQGVADELAERRVVVPLVEVGGGGQDRVGAVAEPSCAACGRRRASPGPSRARRCPRRPPRSSGGRSGGRSSGSRGR